MRKMHPGAVALFLFLVCVSVFVAFGISFGLVDKLHLGDFRGVILSVSLILTSLVAAVCIFRLFIGMRPVPEGDIPIDSSAQFNYQVYVLFYLMIFNPIMFSGFLPIPIMTLFYKLLGAKIGSNSFTVGIVMDPHFVSIGNNSIVGNSALLIPHVIEGERLAHFPITIGNNVTVGAASVVLSDVVIGDGATVAVGAVVQKGCRIPANEVWGGIPAHPIRAQDASGT